MKRWTIGLAACVLAVAVSGQAQAITIFDGGGPDQVNGNEMTLWVQAEDFSLTSPNLKVTDAHFWSLEGYGTAGGGNEWDGTLTYYFFANDETNGPKPTGNPLYTGQGQSIVKAATGLMPLGLAEYKYSFDLVSPVTLAADTTYWFGLHLAADFEHRDEIYWETTSDGDGYGATGEEEYLGPDFPSPDFPDWVWNSNSNHHAFYLTGEPIGEPIIPEPSTFIVWSLLGGLGFAAGWWRRRRRATD